MQNFLCTYINPKPEMSMHTGILEKITLNIGNVGVPTKLSTLNGHCASGNYEITSKIEAAYLSGVTYSTSGQNAWWVFKNPVSVPYTATVQLLNPVAQKLTYAAKRSF